MGRSWDSSEPERITWARSAPMARSLVALLEVVAILAFDGYEIGCLSLSCKRRVSLDGYDLVATHGARHEQVVADDAGTGLTVFWAVALSLPKWRRNCPGREVAGFLAVVLSVPALTKISIIHSRICLFQLLPCATAYHFVVVDETCGECMSAMVSTAVS